MADTELGASNASDPITDSPALTDIATSQGLLLEQLSALETTIGGMGKITLPVVNGGTGLDHVGTGDILYGSAPNVYSLLPDVATDNALISGGVGVAPSWGKITPSHFSGVLPIANGGTNKNAFTSYAVICGGTTSTGALQSIASVGTAGQFFQSNGPGALPSFQTYTLTDGIGGFLTFPANQRYDLWLRSPFPLTITRTTTLSQAGSCTATWQVNTVNQGTPNAVSTTQVSNVQSISVPAGNSINMTISSNASCLNMSFMIEYTRTL